MIKLTSLTRTCLACPAQWEGETESGQRFYARYRHGIFRIDLDGQTVAQVDGHGGAYDGIMETEEMLKLGNVELLPGVVADEEYWESE